MHVRERLKRLMLEEGPLTAAVAAKKLGVSLEGVRYYLKAPEYRIVNYEEGACALRGYRGVKRRERFTPVWALVVGLCDCGAPAWFELRAMAVAVGGGGSSLPERRDEMMCTALVCHECAKASAGKMGVRLAPRWPVAEG